MKSFAVETGAKYFLVSLIVLAVGSCQKTENKSVRLEDIAANEEVLAFMKSFDGRGVLSDSSLPSSPEQALSGFRYPPDLDLALVLAEPAITQPVHISFDHRGRLWVVQYNQYPYPRDLKVTSMDQHIRATFDKVPPPPGDGPQGADLISFFEDTDLDGVYEKSTNAISGLNIATSVAVGRQKIWVLNPPYLLAYPDADDNGIPDGAPEVHLEGFGLEDTHAVANNLRWGPDGWLYGAQGSTCTANIQSAVSKNVRFDGQAIWRYDPETRVFEVFAEGGGNTFDVEIDEKGRIFSGDNGTARGQYYKQGAYYVRNFGKHGALTNPYAFGFLQNMALSGDKVRFTHAFVKYEGGSLPARYQGRMIAINPLLSYVQLSRFAAAGSTFSVEDEKRILETDDHWFRPVDVTLGPDGAVYIADWYDSRLSHVDPRDTWSKNNGRIYRLGNKSSAQSPVAFDLSALSSDELIGMFSHENRWFRHLAVQQFSTRKDTLALHSLISILEDGKSSRALEALWAINLMGGFSDGIAITGLKHKDPFVRLWSIRLAGDSRYVSDRLAHEIQQVALHETHAEVRSQLAATAKRLPGREALPILRNLLKRDDSADPDIPLQIWWALESKAVTDRKAVIDLFTEASLWRNPTVRTTLVERLMQRYVMDGDSLGFASCARLISLAPSMTEVKLLFNGLQEGLRGKDLVSLPPVLLKALKPYQNELTGESMILDLRQGKKEAIAAAISVINDPAAPIGERLSYVRLFGEIDAPETVNVLLDLVESHQSSAALKQASLQSLQRYDSEQTGKRVVKAYPDKLRADPGVRLAALSLFASRPQWAVELLDAIYRKREKGEDFIAHTIRKEDVPHNIVLQLKGLNDSRVTQVASRLWPEVRFASTSEKTGRMNEVAKILQKGRGNAEAGRQIFRSACGPCHRLFNEGGRLGPDLTGYDRRNVNDLLTNILDPGAYVREGFASYRIATRDGRLLSGTISERRGTSVVLNLLSGETVTLQEGEIKDMQAQPSIMPDNLLEGMTDQEVQDLFAYLMKGS